MRAFIALEMGFNEEMRHFYTALEKTGARLKMVEPENVHLTIKFLGDIKEEMVKDIRKIMEDAVKDIQPFRGVIRGVGAFPGINNIRVIWLGFHDDGEVVKISKTIDENLSSLGFRKERSYVPHITVARMKSGLKKEEVIRVLKEYEEREFGEVECKEIKLKKSILTRDGPIYEDIEVVKI
ncbi:MAG TPA: RNA 2',3'-cyclic phosphodiesterase [Thermoplasmatales archaeon]|nr:RNA 2',3'-cyclic phosphodiesterase [Thermoplasmatales archaeon]